MSDNIGLLLPGPDGSNPLAFLAAGREATPSAVCIDSQSVKTTEVGGVQRG